MVSENEVARIARLANLEVDSREVAGLAEDMNSILNYVRLLESLDVSDVQPMSHVHGFTNVLREDNVYQEIRPEKILEQVPERRETYIQVPLIIEQAE